MKLKNIYKTFSLPHLHGLEIHFMDMKYLKGVEIQGAGFHSVMEDGSVLIFIQDINTSVKDIKKMPVIAHEVVHLLQHICETFSMEFYNESEHMAYIMYYIIDGLVNS